MSEASSGPVRRRSRLPPWLRLVGWTLGRVVTAFLVASALLFLLSRALPGDPLALRLKNPDPERVEELRELYGLNDPLPVQYVRFAADFVTGDWGVSLVNGREVAGEIGRHLPATLEMVILALLAGVLGGAGIALAGEALGWSLMERASRAMGTIGLTIPIFWLGQLLLLTGSLWLGWFPPGGRFSYALTVPEVTGFLTLDTLLAGRPDRLLTALTYLALPVLCLAFYPAALVSGTLRERFGNPQVRNLLRALRARGIPEWRIWLKHIPRLLGAPVVTIIGTNLGALIGGAVLTETVFSWPGMGRFLVDSALNRDYPVMTTGILLVVLGALLVMALTDWLAAWVNPRARRMSEAGR